MQVYKTRSKKSGRKLHYKWIFINDVYVVG